MNKNELRKLMIKENTIAAARKKVQQLIRYMGSDTEIYVRCYTSIGWGTLFSTDLYIDLINGEDSETITLASIEIDTEEEGSKYWGADIDICEFEEITWEIFEPMKNNMIKELKQYNYKITSTENCSM